ncbi:carboxymuconolactone decarboxylase family protein [Nocardia otitidiscaviarum]|uniref:Arsenate reductase and related proteins, glutaredoxin family n=1 Tax=Nocardia otitidiscaviarum TaxID=1823 RepID=A0A378YA29_9NOCA|nr:carboxymuconolactone decarboxylase family protein [Nocardia otitidiscaviarum]MBF6131670.1 carboxymuconolactone decarboxylase family protein [Nocardia otitidiscaviarum]MBF6238327.1 carboxymuconolactone decarboxylase family protein [Nocardia otitidiscaviarum]MBF6482802.1 carboxymuconolactone decarboxylase family protein [Nocardia otitidiscaviarum]SUA73237.1 Arsenate reductase and related proteins, glutaredoxin family [Nocardia otitidiscaviarum]
MTRFALYENEVAAKFTKRLVTAARVTDDSTLPKPTQELVKIRASQINGCGMCLDMHTKDAAHAGETPLRLAMIAAWRESTVFTEAERAALALTEEGTRLADNGRGISEQTWSEVRKHYDDDQIAALITLIATINAWNRLNVIAGLPGGEYVPGQW